MLKPLERVTGVRLVPTGTTLQTTLLHYRLYLLLECIQRPKEELFRTGRQYGKEKGTTEAVPYQKDFLCDSVSLW